MAIRQLRYDGDEILRKKSRKVEEVDDKIRELMNDMVETMHAENGVGLSAVQVGILKRVIVIDLYDGTEPLKLVNPEILKVEIKIKAKELLAQALCHEINHLDGVLFVDLMEPGTMEYIDPNNKK